MSGCGPKKIDERTIGLRRAASDDMRRIFEWRNLPEIRALGTNQEPISWEEHQRWFACVVESDRHLLLIITLAGEPIGQVRFDRQQDDIGSISIYLTPGHFERGIGTIALRRACWAAFAELKVTCIRAIIRKENARSVAAFRKAGFTKTESHSTDWPPNHVVVELGRPQAVPHNRLTYDETEAKAIAEVVQSGQWACGPRVAQLESMLATVADVRHAVCVASGMSALRLTLLGLGVRANSRVLIPAYCCVALANAVLACGATPVVADVRPKEWCVTRQEAQKALVGGSVDVAIIVNTFGVPSPTEDIEGLGISVIEDCAHAFGFQTGNKKLGNRSAAAILSFYATKLIGAGEGGAVLTNSDELAHFVHSWRDYADQSPSGTKLNDKMTDIEASLAICQLRRLPQMIESRCRLAKRYDQLLTSANMPEIFSLPPMHSRVWYRYVVEMHATSASDMARRLLAYDVHADLPVYDWRTSSETACSNADLAYRSLLSLPLFPTLTECEQDRVVFAFLRVCGELATSCSSNS